MRSLRAEIDQNSQEYMLELNDLEELRDMKKKYEGQKGREQKEKD